MGNRILAILGSPYLDLCRQLSSQHDLVVPSVVYDQLGGAGRPHLSLWKDWIGISDRQGIDEYVLRNSSEIFANASLALEDRVREALGLEVRFFESMGMQFPNWCKDMLLVAAVTRNLVSRDEVALVVVENDVRGFQRAAIDIARRHGVQSLCIAHGIPTLLNLHDTIRADVMAVYGERCRRWYRSAGNPEGKIRVTGAPRLDPYYRLRGQEAREDMRRRLGLAEDVPVVTLATTWRAGMYLREFTYNPGDIAADTLQALGRVQRKRDFQLLVKPHPTDPYSDEDYTRLAQSEGVRIDGFYPRGWNLPNELAPLFSATDVLLCYQSTIGVEALIWGLEVISLSLHVPELLFEETSCVRKASTREELVEQLSAALMDWGSTEERVVRAGSDLEYLNAGNDGRATERVAALVDAMIQEPRGERGLAMTPSVPAASERATSHRPELLG